MQAHDRVAATMAAVDYDSFVLEPNGERVIQSSAAPRIARTLRELDVEQGDFVLEIGTGSGFSTAVLVSLVQPTGSVVSLDIDPALTVRARSLFEQRGIRNVVLATDDGRTGYGAGGSFDRVVVWGATETIPATWVSQLKPGGILVTTVRLRPLALAMALVRCHRGPVGELVAERLRFDSAAPLTDSPRHSWDGPAEEADVASEVRWHIRGRDQLAEPRDWLSAASLRMAPTSAKERLLELLRTTQACRPPTPTPTLPRTGGGRLSAGLLGPGEDARDLWAYLLAVAPDGLATAGTKGAQVMFGCADPDGFALIPFDKAAYIEGGSGSSGEHLLEWIASWRAAGRPGFDRLTPLAAPTADGWRIQAVVGRG